MKGNCLQLLFLHLFDETFHHIGQFAFVNWFQQVIEGRFADRIEHIFIVSRIKDDLHVPCDLVADQVQ